MAQETFDEWEKRDGYRYDYPEQARESAWDAATAGGKPCQYHNFGGRCLNIEGRCNNAACIIIQPKDAE
jgi:hypothetical protein